MTHFKWWRAAAQDLASPGGKDMPFGQAPKANEKDGDDGMGERAG